MGPKRCGINCITFCKLNVFCKFYFELFIKYKNLKNMFIIVDPDLFNGPFSLLKGSLIVNILLLVQL